MTRHEVRWGIESVELEQKGHEEAVWKREELIQSLVHALRKVFVMEGGVLEGR